MDLTGLSSFETVWQRVQNGKTEEKVAPYADLERLMDGICSLVKDTRRLGELACGEERKCLQEQARRMKKRYDRLQVYLFLMTGDLRFSDHTAKFASYTPYNLRKLWQITVENADLLKKCNLHESEGLVAELQRTEAELVQMRCLLENLMEKLLR